MVAAVATFLVVLAFLSAQLQAGGDPGLVQTRTAAVRPAESGSSVVTTRVSGGGGPAAEASPGGQSHAPQVSTRQSGGAAEQD